MLLVSAVTCLAVLHNLGSVGIGTIIAAVLAGTVVGIITKAFGKQREDLTRQRNQPPGHLSDMALLFPLHSF